MVTTTNMATFTVKETRVKKGSGINYFENRDE
jgi:hypothetical protein